MGAFIRRPCLPCAERNTSSRIPWLQRHYPPSSLLRTPPPPSRFRSLSRVHRLYDLPGSIDFAMARGRLLQLLDLPCVTVLSLPPRRSVLRHRSECRMPCCLRPGRKGSAARIPPASSFDCPSFLSTFLLDYSSILNPSVKPEIKNPTAMFQGWDVINGAIHAFGAFGLDRHDRGAHKTIATFQGVQSEECRPDGSTVEHRTKVFRTSTDTSFSVLSFSQSLSVSVH
jgi:hypothetical protein